MPLCGGKKVVQRKLVLLGDGACGKTSLLNVFTRGFFPVCSTLDNSVHPSPIQPSPAKHQ